MKRIIPARCTACDKGSQDLESSVWPNVRVCFQCYRKFRDFMLVNRFADSNLFFFDLVEPLTEGNYPYRMALHDRSQVLVCMGPSRYDDSASGTWHVNVPIELESENNLHDDLDFLFKV